MNLNILGFQFHKFMIIMTDEITNRPYVQYKVETPTHVIFEGDTFSPDARFWNNPIGYDAQLQILDYLCTCIDNGNEEDFIGYTSKQLEWASSKECRDLRLELDCLLEKSPELAVG